MPRTHFLNTTALVTFFRDEQGAVTVDWVVLTAAIVGLGLAAMAVVSGGTETLATGIDTQLTTQEITQSFASAWVSGDWEMNNPGIYDNYSAWMAGFEDAALLAHMANMEQYSESEPGAGHPYDTYHDEYWIARDEAIQRGLISA